MSAAALDECIGSIVVLQSGLLKYIHEQSGVGSRPLEAGRVLPTSSRYLFSICQNVSVSLTLNCEHAAAELWGGWA